jgi:hypothetical protein
MYARAASPAALPCQGTWLCRNTLTRRAHRTVRLTPGSSMNFIVTIRKAPVDSGRSPRTEQERHRFVGYASTNDEEKGQRPPSYRYAVPCRRTWCLLLRHWPRHFRYRGPSNLPQVRPTGIRLDRVSECADWPKSRRQPPGPAQSASGKWVNSPFRRFRISRISWNRRSWPSAKNVFLRRGGGALRPKPAS